VVALRDALVGLAVVAFGIVVVVVLLVSRSHIKTQDQLPKANRLASFEQQWREAGMTVPLAKPTQPIIEQAAKQTPIQDMVLPSVIVEGASKGTHITKDETAEPEPVRSANPRHRATRDVCRGKGRVYTKNGKSWRCKR